MTTVVVTEKAIREYLREAMRGNPHAGVFADAPVNTSDVVDPSEAVTDPDNDNFRPRSKAEFKTALSSMVDDLNDNDAPDAYDAVKGALSDLKDDEDEGKAMSSEDDKVEEAIRLEVRKMMSEAWTKGPNGEEIWTDETPKKGPKKGKPEPGPVTGALPPVKKLEPAAHGGEFNRGVERNKRDLKKALKTWDDSSVEDAVDPDAPKAGRDRKNKMMTDVGGASFKEMAAELGFASESGAKQACERVQAKAQFMQALPEEEQEILILTAMQDYIEALATGGQLTPADVKLMKDHPTIVADLDTFRVFLAKYIKKAMKDAPVKESLSLGEARASKKPLAKKKPWESKKKDEKKSDKKTDKKKVTEGSGYIDNSKIASLDSMAKQKGGSPASSSGGVQEYSFKDDSAAADFAASAGKSGYKNVQVMGGKLVKVGIKNESIDMLKRMIREELGCMDQGSKGPGINPYAKKGPREDNDIADAMGRAMDDGGSAGEDAWMADEEAEWDAEAEEFADDVPALLPRSISGRGVE